VKKLIYTFIIFFIGVLNVDAIFCDYSELTRIRKQASQVNIMSEYKEVDDEVLFTITIYNLRPNQYVIDTITNKRYDYGYNKEKESEIVIDNIKKSGMYKFEVYSIENTCNEKALNTLYVTLPTYNKYYKDKLCKGIESYKLCQKWFGTEITYERFKEEINNYKNSIKPNEEIDEEKEETIFDYLINIYINTYYIILPLFIIILLMPIYSIYKKKYKVDF